MKTTSDVKLLFDLGMQPISNRFLMNADSEKKLFPLKLAQSQKTGLIQLMEPVPYEELVPIFDWITYNEPEEHLDGLVDEIFQYLPKNKSLNIGGVSWKDHSTLERFSQKGCKTWVLDMKKDLSLSKHVGVESVQNAFSQNKAISLANKYGRSDLLIARHIWEHAYNHTDFSNALKELVKDDGLIYLEIPDCENQIKNFDYTTIWEEHLYYYTPSTFSIALNQCGFDILLMKKFPYPHESAIAVLMKKCESNRIKFDNNEISRELAMGQKWGEMFNQTKKAIHKYLSEKTKKGGITLFGAGHFSHAFISFFGVDKYINCVIDDNTNKKGMMMPIGKIPIVGSNILQDLDINLCLLAFNPTLHEKVISKYKYFEERGGEFASIFPGTNREMEVL